MISVDQSWQMHTASNTRRSRMRSILALIAERQSASLFEIADELRISTVTARRYVAEMASQRLLVRTHGGASSVASQEVPLTLRDMHLGHLKQTIARTAATWIGTEHAAIALSGGSTTACVAREIARMRSATVVTNSLTIANVLITSPDVRVVMTGGYLRGRSAELVGRLAELTFGSVAISVAVLGADGLSATHGVSVHDAREAETNRAMVAAAQQTLVVADGSKIGRTAGHTVVDLSGVDALITDSSADPEALARIRSAGTEVVLADRLAPGYAA